MIKSIDVNNDKNMMVLFEQTGDDGNDQHTTHLLQWNSISALNREEKSVDFV